MNFIHGDMHAGNIMIDLANRQSTVLDYGNAILLDTDRINAIVNMTTAAGVNRADIFVEHFDKMLKYSARDEAKSKQKVGYAPMSAKVKAAYKKRLDEVFKLGDPGDNGKRILVALSIAQELGIKMPKEMQNFSQCEQRLENTVLDVKNETLKLCEGIDIMDNLPVDDADLDSVDPLIRLHIYRQQQRSAGREDSRDIILEYAKRYKLMPLDHIYSDVGDMEKSGDAATVIDTYLPEYSELKKKLILQRPRKQLMT